MWPHLLPSGHGGSSHLQPPIASVDCFICLCHDGVCAVRVVVPGFSGNVSTAMFIKVLQLREGRLACA